MAFKGPFTLNGSESNRTEHLLCFCFLLTQDFYLFDLSCVIGLVADH